MSALAGTVAFLLWLWISNLAVLLGAAFDAERAVVRPPGRSDRSAT